MLKKVLQIQSFTIAINKFLFSLKTWRDRFGGFFAMKVFLQIDETPPAFWQSFTAVTKRKVGLSPFKKTVLFSWMKKPFKMVKTAFNFILKAVSFYFICLNILVT